jgi:hypothetical protein
MFRKKHVSVVCDNPCRAAQPGEQELFEAAQQGPTI